MFITRWIDEENVLTHIMNGIYFSHIKERHLAVWNNDAYQWCYAKRKNPVIGQILNGFSHVKGL